MVTYLPEEDRYAPINEIDINKTKTLNLFGARLRKRLKVGGHIPEWFSYPGVVKILRESKHPTSKQGFVIVLDDYLQVSESKLSIALLSTFLQFGGGRHYKIFEYDNYVRLFDFIPDFIQVGSGLIVSQNNSSIRYANVYR